MWAQDESRRRVRPLCRDVQAGRAHSPPRRAACRGDSRSHRERVRWSPNQVERSVVRRVVTGADMTPRNSSRRWPLAGLAGGVEALARAAWRFW